MLAQTYPKYLCAEKIWLLGNLYAVMQGASSTPTICCAHAYNLSLCTTTAEVSEVTAGLHGVHPACSCRRCGPASSKKSLVGSFPHLALGAVFKLILA